jgi:hypothetical protein
MPGGRLTDDGKTTPMNKPVEQLTEKLGAKPATKIEWNKIIPATSPTIDLTHRLWSKPGYSHNINKLQFIEIGQVGKPIKAMIQSNKKTKIPVP